MKPKKELRCKECGSAEIYTLADRTKVCKRCGFREKVESVEFNINGKGGKGGSSGSWDIGTKNDTNGGYGGYDGSEVKNERL